MKGRVSFLLALAGTVFAMSAGLGAVVSGEPGILSFIVTLFVIGLWLMCAGLCSQSAALSRATLACMLLTAATGSLGLIPFASENEVVALAWMLALAPFYGLAAICDGGAQATFIMAAVCSFIGFFSVAMRRQSVLRQDSNIVALEREMVEPRIDPALAIALERKTKRALGMRDPEDRLERKPDRLSGL